MWPNANAHFVAFQAQLVERISIRTGGFAGFKPQTNQRHSWIRLMPSKPEFGIRKLLNTLHLI